MAKYLGMEFKNKDELFAWNRDGLVNEYKTLNKLFIQQMSYAMIDRMQEIADVLVNQYGYTYEQVEELELAE